MKDLSYGAKQFIKKNVNLIRNKAWVPLFEELGKSNMFNPGEVTDALLEICGYSLDEMLKDYYVIPFRLFSGSLINSIKIPSHITEIENKAFEKCQDLTSITIPNSVTSIGDEAFEGCKKLSKAVVDNPNAIFQDDVFFRVPSSFELYGYKGSTAEAYAKANGHKFVAID